MMKKRNRLSSKTERPHPLEFLAGVIGGGVLLFFGLDIHFFHVIPSGPVDNNHPLWIIMSALGVLMIVVSIRHMIKPPSLSQEEDEFDPSGIDDAIARDIAWTHLAGWTSNFCTHRLIKVSENRLEFRPTPKGKQFSRILILVGSWPLLALCVHLVAGNVNDVVTPVAVVVIGCIFVGLGFSNRYRSSIPIIFDRTLGLFWKGRGPTQWAARWQGSIRFTDIYALQLVSQWHPSQRSSGGSRGAPSYFSHELILVLNNSTRVSVVCHGGRKELLEDAATLSQFLERPLWNGITDE